MLIPLAELGLRLGISRLGQLTEQLPARPRPSKHRCFEHGSLSVVPPFSDSRSGGRWPDGPGWRRGPAGRLRRREANGTPGNVSGSSASISNNSPPSRRVATTVSASPSAPRTRARWRSIVFVSSTRTGSSSRPAVRNASAFRSGSMDVLTTTVSDGVNRCEYGRRSCCGETRRASSPSRRSPRRRRASGIGVVPPDEPADRVGVRPEALGHRFTGDDHGLGVRPVGVVEVAPCGRSRCLPPLRTPARPRPGPR